MDNKQAILTAAGVGVGGVVLAYLGHSYLLKKQGEATDMDKAAEKTSQGSFFDWFTSDSNDENGSNETEMKTIAVKETITTADDKEKEINAKEADSVVAETLTALKKFWKAEYDTNNGVSEVTKEE